MGENPSTPPETLAWLATIENDFGLRARVLTNPSTPVDTLRSFIDSPDSFFWNCLVQNTGAGDTFVLEFVDAHCAEVDVMLRALRNVSISDSTFEHLATYRVAGAAAAFVAEMRRMRAAC